MPFIFLFVQLWCAWRSLLNRPQPGELSLRFLQTQGFLLFAGLLDTRDHSFVPSCSQYDPECSVCVFVLRSTGTTGIKHRPPSLFAACQQGRVSTLNATIPTYTALNDLALPLIPMFFMSESKFQTSVSSQCFNKIIGNINRIGHQDG